MLNFIKRMYIRAKDSVSGIVSFEEYIEAYRFQTNPKILDTKEMRFPTQTIRQYIKILSNIATMDVDEVNILTGDEWEGDVSHWYANEYLETGVNYVRYNEEFKSALIIFFRHYQTLYKDESKIYERRMLKRIHNENIRILGLLKRDLNPK